MSEKQKRSGCIRMGIICFEIFGVLNVIFALLGSFTLFEQFSGRTFEILVTTIPIFFIVIGWINFFSPSFFLWKDRPALIKALVFALSVLPMLIFIIPSILPIFFGEPEFDVYKSTIVRLRQYLAEAGVWFGLAINLRRSFPTTPTAERHSKDSQSAIA